MTTLLKAAYVTELRELMNDWLAMDGHCTIEQTAQLAARIHHLCDYLDNLDKV